MIPAPVLRGSFADSLPTDLAELAAWFNLRLADAERPVCRVCRERARIGTDGRTLFWHCPTRRGACRYTARLVDEANLYAYAARRLRHAPTECRSERSVAMR